MIAVASEFYPRLSWRSRAKSLLVLIMRCAVALCMSNSVSAQARRRPLLVVIHGRGQAFQLREPLENQWWAALDDGLRAVAAQDLIPATDRRFVFYGDVYEYSARSSGQCGTHGTGLSYERAGL